MMIARGTELAHSKPRKKGIFNEIWRQIDIQTMVWPGIIFMLIFNYLPMYGVIIAFKNFVVTSGFQGFFTSKWVGLKHFADFLTDPNFYTVLKNTLGINIMGLMIRFPITIIFALFLNEITNDKFKRFTQTVSYLPHFLSWVIYGGLIIKILSVETGAVNNYLLKWGIIDEPIFFLGEPKYFWSIAVISALLKELGWSAILYLAAIAGVDQELYEAAIIDGAGRFKRMWHITLPSISGTIVILLIFAISGILSSGFDQIWMLQNPLNVDASEVIDTYVYKVGLQQMRFSYSTAVGLMRSVVAVILLLGANFVSNKITEKGIF